MVGRRSNAGGGTSLPPERSIRSFVVFGVVAPVTGYLVNRLAAGDECGWDYGAVGGACRAIILLAIIAGVVAGLFAAACSRALRDDNSRRATVLGVLAIVTVVLGVLAAGQFQDYRRAGQRIHD